VNSSEIDVSARNFYKLAQTVGAIMMSASISEKPKYDSNILHADLPLNWQETSKTCGRNKSRNGAEINLSNPFFFFYGSRKSQLCVVNALAVTGRGISWIRSTLPPAWKALKGMSDRMAETLFVFMCKRLQIERDPIYLHASNYMYFSPSKLGLSETFISCTLLVSL